MPVNQTLSNYSDLAFQSAVVIYLVALGVSLFLYGRLQIVIDAKRELAQVKEKEAELVAVGGGSTSIAAESGEPSADQSTLEEELVVNERKADRFAGMTQALVWLGLLFHGAAIVLRGLATNRFPLGNLYEYVMAISLGVMLATVIALSRKSWRAMWPWVLTPMLILMFYGGTELYAESAPVVPALQSNWMPIHVTTVVIGASIGIVSGVASLLFMLRHYQPAGQEEGFFGVLAKPLPSAKKLDNLAYRTAVITLPTFGLGILFGAIWAEAAWGRFWGWDPKETVSFITWVLYAGYLHARATPSWRGVKSAWINIAALATMIFNLFFINMVVSGLHSYAGLN